MELESQLPYVLQLNARASLAVMTGGCLPIMQMSFPNIFGRIYAVDSGIRGLSTSEIPIGDNYFIYDEGRHYRILGLLVFADTTC